MRLPSAGLGPPWCPWPVWEAGSALACSEAGFWQEQFSPSTEEVGAGTYRWGLNPVPPRRDPSKPEGKGPRPRQQLAAQQTCSPVADYKCFNSSNVSIRPWSWNYRSCWHQTCPPVDTHDCLWIASIPSPIGIDCRQDCYCSSLPHRLSLHGAICVPAAHLGSGSRLSGSLSEIEP